MASRLEYDVRVQRLFPATVAAFAGLAVALFTLFLLMVPRAGAQAHGAPASVTSEGFGGHAVNGTAPSVTSFGSHGSVSFETGSHGSTSNSHGMFPGSLNGPGAGANDHAHRHHRQDGYGAGYWIGVPYAVDLAPQQEQEEDNAQEPENDEAGYQGGPTVFDRRGSGADSYVPPVSEMPRPHQATPYANAAEDTPQTQTVLVFRNGQQIEVSNYAIQGDTLFDLTPGHSRRVALANLDLEATRQQNENRGVVFELPGAQAN
jgi:hypothetical protein